LHLFSLEFTWWNFISMFFFHLQNFFLSHLFFLPFYLKFYLDFLGNFFNSPHACALAIFQTEKFSPKSNFLTHHSVSHEKIKMYISDNFLEWKWKYPELRKIQRKVFLWFWELFSHSSSWKLIILKTSRLWVSSINEMKTMKLKKLSTINGLRVLFVKIFLLFF
jgi:hypothetical protein